MKVCPRATISFARRDYRHFVFQRQASVTPWNYVFLGNTSGTGRIVNKAWLYIYPLLRMTQRLLQSASHFSHPAVTGSSIQT